MIIIKYTNSLSTQKNLYAINIPQCRTLKIVAKVYKYWEYTHKRF